MSLLLDKDHHIESLDLSGNELNADHLEQILVSLSRNKHLTGIDVRRNPGFNEGELFIFLTFLFCLAENY